MPLIKSISGIRGTIGGKTGENLTPLDCVKFASAYAQWLKQEQSSKNKKLKICIGRDARISGDMVQNLVSASIIAMGIDVINLGLSTTPTVEIMVTKTNSDGGIIITASHNPKQWNALKLLNSKGEFLDDKDGQKVLQIAEKESFEFVNVDNLGKIQDIENSFDTHIEDILKLKLVNKNLIEKEGFKVGVDAVNSTGGIAIPMLLKSLGVKNIELLNCEPTGIFAHNPEPLKEHLQDICKLVKDKKLDLAIVTDPDVDRLAFIDENGEMFGEEYTLVAIADYILSKSEKNKNTASNLSSSRALADITIKHGGKYFSAAVGEVNVVKTAKENNCVICGEGNGGIIYPESHYGRDALVGTALFLTYLAEKKMKVSEIKKELPIYFMSKSKVELNPQIDVDKILQKMAQKYKNEKITTIDGVKIDFENSWAHLRKSNTEPIIRIYTEAKTQQQADELAEEIGEIILKNS